MDIDGKAMWQQAAGDNDRNYADIWLRWDVVLNGPGYAGPWPACRAALQTMIITTAVKAVPVKQIGYSGLMVPVMEDKLLAKRWAEGVVTTDSLLAYSAVCGTGLDTVPLPGDISVAQLERIFGDVASLAWKWNKPLSARLQPVFGKKAGDETEFNSQYLFNTKIHAAP